MSPIAKDVRAPTSAITVPQGSPWALITSVSSATSPTVQVVLQLMYANLAKVVTTLSTIPANLYAMMSIVRLMDVRPTLRCAPVASKDFSLLMDLALVATSTIARPAILQISVPLA